ncbi:MAG: AMP-binding protein, partial [Paludibacteraceae bacterium]|nr:AMP-binding protein [Paludibacteraceae bacterium]
MELFEKTIGEWLEYWANETPEREYLVYADRNLRFTWKSFNERVDNMAKGLMAIDVKKGDHVGIFAQNVPDWLTFLYACAKIGAIAVTLNTSCKEHELAYIIENSDMHTLCMTEGDNGNDFIKTIHSLIPELKTSERGRLKSNRFPVLKNVVFIGQEKHRGMYTTAEILLLGTYQNNEEYFQLKKTINCQDVVNMQYTSGTTGFPKGVMLTHHNITNNGFYTGEHMKFTNDDKLCICVPLFHCFGIVL